MSSTVQGTSEAGNTRPTPSSPMGGAGAWRADFLASIVVFLVALPLCIGIAVAVNVSPARALITGIIGGMVVGLFAGSPLQVSGPAAGLFVIVADLLMQARAKFLEQAGDVTALSAEAQRTLELQATEYSLFALGAAVLLAGVMQGAAGLLRLGQWFRAVSPAVIEGMLGGIGVLILVSQFHVMLDHEALYNGHKAHGGVQYLATIPEAIWKCFASTETHTHHLAAATGIITISAIVMWRKLAPKAVQLIPAALVAVLVATAFANFTELSVQRLKVPDNLLDEVSLPQLVTLQLLINPQIWLSAFVIAVVASAETLLCATAVDQMNSGPRTQYDQELFAQGIGNILCGLLGALPMTGVIVRSSANVQAGARTRWSAVLHGLWLLLFVVAFPFLLAYIPRAALGAILVYTGYKLIDVEAIRHLWKFSRSEAIIYFTTLTVIVVEDLLMGVVVGIVLSALKLLYVFSHLQTRLQTDESITRLYLSGAATFIRLPYLVAELDRVPAGTELHVDFTELDYIDHACLDLLMNWAKQHEITGGKLVLDWESLHARFRTSPNGNGNTNKPQANHGAS